MDLATDEVDMRLTAGHGGQILAVADPYLQMQGCVARERTSWRGHLLAGERVARQQAGECAILGACHAPGT